MHPIFEKYLTILLEAFEKDIAIMSQPWMIYTILPIIGYLIFFIIKWAVLTTPVWMPFAIIFGSRRPVGVNKKEKEE